MRIPRLNRRGKVVRNLLAIAVLGFALWAYTGFPAPTEGLALKWEAERYFTEPGEIVLRVDQTGGASPWLKWFADRKSVLTYRDGYLTCYQHQRWLTAHIMDYEGTYPHCGRGVCGGIYRLVTGAGVLRGPGDHRGAHRDHMGGKDGIDR